MLRSLILMFRHSSLLLFFVPWYEKSCKCKCADISPNQCKISLEVPCEIERQQRTVKRQQRTVVKGGKLREDGMRLFFDGFSTEGRSFLEEGVRESPRQNQEADVTHLRLKKFCAFTRRDAHKVL